MVPELAALVWYDPWQCYVVIDAVDPGGDRREHDDLYLLAQRPEQTGAGIAIYRWLDPDPDVADELFLPAGEPQTFAGLRDFPARPDRARAWERRLQRLDDAL